MCVFERLLACIICATLDKVSLVLPPLQKFIIIIIIIIIIKLSRFCQIMKHTHTDSNTHTYTQQIADFKCIFSSFKKSQQCKLGHVLLRVILSQIQTKQYSCNKGIMRLMNKFDHRV